MNLQTTGEKSAKGTPVVDMWDPPMPDPNKSGAGFPVLNNAEHTKIYHATREKGGFSHHARLLIHDGVFYAMWSNHPHGEDSPGQFVRFSVSKDGKTWSNPQRLFPPYGTFDVYRALGPFGTAAEWLVHEGAVYGIMVLDNKTGFANTDRSSVQPTRDKQHIFPVRQPIATVARSVDATKEEAALGPIVRLPNLTGQELDAKQPLTEQLIPPDEERRQTAEALTRLLQQRRPWRKLKALDSPRPVEPTFYRTADGKRACLMRDDAYSHRMYVSISEDVENWPLAQPTNIPDSPSLSDTVALDDGTVLLIGNQVAPQFDNWDEVTHYKRDPLTVAVSPDGYRFTHVFALRAGAPEHHVPDVGGRGRGAQYPNALVHDDRLYVLYSMGKEDIWISSVPLAQLLHGKKAQ